MTDVRPEIGRLAAELRLLRERSGLSFAALGEQTPYSRSAWQRYLTAKALPPWSAVQALCQLADEPEAKPRALWELAESANSGRGAITAAPATPAPIPEQVPTIAPPRKRRTIIIASVLGLAAVAAAIVFAVHPSGETHRTTKVPSQVSAEDFKVSCTSGPCDATCAGVSCNGQDPQLTLCGLNPQPLLQQQTPAGVGLEVHYSSRCEAAWARIWNDQVGDTLTLSARGAPTQTIRVSSPQDLDSFAYTPMIFVAGGDTPLRVCVTAADETANCYTATP